MNKCNNFAFLLRSSLYSVLLFKNIQGFYVGKNVKFLGEKIKIAKGCYLMDNSLLHGDVCLYENVYIHENVSIKSYKQSITIGNGTTINRNTCILGKCFVGSMCSIAPNVVIVGENHVFKNKDLPIKIQGTFSKGIVIQDDVWIAANATILDGVIIGKGSVVAAGAVVNKDVPPYSVVAGIPAKVVKSR